MTIDDPLEGHGKYYILTKKGKHQAYIFVSATLARDSAFPFKHRDKLQIEIKDGKLTITKAE